MSTRLKNTISGVTVEIADEKVARLGSEWQPEDFAPPVEVDAPDEILIGSPPAVEVAPAPASEPKLAPGRPKKLTALPE